MLGKKNSFGWARGVMAVCLAVLLSSASLVPLAARSLSAFDAACCKGHARNCCRKAHTNQPAGPALSSRPCGSDCGRLAPGSIGTSEFVPPSFRPLAPPTESLRGPHASEPSLAAHFSGHALRQRPPPTSSLA